jgi:hypothetical protein
VGGPSVQSIFNQFLQNGSRAFNHLTCRYLIGNVVRKNADPGHGIQCSSPGESQFQLSEELSYQCFEARSGGYASVQNFLVSQWLGKDPRSHVA